MYLLTSFFCLSLQNKCTTSIHLHIQILGSYTREMHMFTERYESANKDIKPTEVELKSINFDNK